MPSNHTALIEYWGLKCPKRGKFYICEDDWVEFFGCCTIDPCGDGGGVCPSENLGPLSIDSERYAELPVQECLASSINDFYICAFEPTFMGCCDTNACNSGCSFSSLGISALSQIEQNRRHFLYPSELNLTKPPSTKIILEPISTLSSSRFPTSVYNRASSRNAALIKPGPMAGTCIAVLLATLMCIGLIAKYCKCLPTKTKHGGPTYSRISSQDAIDQSKNLQAAGTKTASDLNSSFEFKPQNLQQSKFAAFMVWTWNIILTLIPMCFIALAIAVIDLDGRTKSSYGKNILELTRLSPSLYPILFAAIAGRFYKNIARWCLEQPGGIRLAVLEQVFGNQSFATALERVFVVHTHLFFSIFILCTWALSPLGGQSASRILSFGKATDVSNGTISYLHPAFQVSSYMSQQSLFSTKGSIAALYSSSLLSSLEQKQSPRDMWELPKIPQWKSDNDIGETYLVNREALENGSDYYTSLLGNKVQGLDISEGTIQYDFTLQTSYIDLQCSLENDNYTGNFPNNTLLALSTDQIAPGAIVDIVSPLPWAEWKSLESPPPLQLLYLSKWEWPSSGGGVSEKVWAAINCTMQAIWIETEIHCGPSPSARSFYAHKQRRLRDETSSNRLPRLMTRNYGALRQAISFWLEASGDSSVNKPSATENYIMGEVHPYAGHNSRNWRQMDRKMFPKQISRRLTTAFNTFWDATLNPLGHTNITFSTLDGKNVAFENEFNTQPFMNLTTGTMTVSREVYRASELWVAVLLTTALFLQILAILGLILEVLIVGPEVLGYASSLTRDNVYVSLPATGSSLSGPQRSRALRDLRLQLADVRPDEDIGYIAVRAIPSKSVDENTEQDSIELMSAGVASEQVLPRRLDSKRLYR